MIGYYINTGKKKYKMNYIQTLKDYIYEVKLIEYDKKCHKHLRIYYEHYNSNEPLFLVLSRKNKKLEINPDTLMSHIYNLILTTNN